MKHSNKALLFTFLVLGTWVFPAACAQTTTGVPSVIDGDTIEIRSVRFRLFGIDAPESSQMCLDKAGHPFRCGQMVALKLAEYLRGKNVHCVKKTQDRYGRTVAVCGVVGSDTTVNRWLINQGFAVAYTQYSTEHVAAETIARKNKVGLWAGVFQNPADYRKDQKNPSSNGMDGNTTDVYFANCNEARKAGVAPLKRGQPGYREAMDADKDGTACE